MDFKQLVKATPVYPWLRAWWQGRTIRAWEQQGRPVPPPHALKQRVLRTYAHQYGLKILVETGTYSGDMVEALKREFERIYSIELSPELFARAQVRFAADAQVTLIQGDSAQELGRLLPRLDQPVLFWLDGHYSGGATAQGEKETPIQEELRDILQQCPQPWVIVIDDARCFGTFPTYPTVLELEALIHELNPTVTVTVADDLIRVLPAQGVAA